MFFLYVLKAEHFFCKFAVENIDSKFLNQILSECGFVLLFRNFFMLFINQIMVSFRMTVFA